MYKSILTLLVGAIVFSSTTCSNTKKIAAPKIKTKEEILAIRDPFHQYFALNQGTFVMRGTENGVETDRFLYNVVQIFETDKSDYWLYAEGVRPAFMEEPIDQSVMHFVRIQSDSFKVESYHLKDKGRFKLASFDKELLNTLKKTDLIHKGELCDEWVVVLDKGVFSSKSYGMCEMPSEAGPKRRFSENTVRVDYGGLCVNTTFYGVNKEVTKNPNKECTPFKRDISGTYQKKAQEILAQKKGK